MKNLQISKTDYLNFRFCRKDLWLKKNRPDEFPPDQLSEFQLELVKEGQEVDGEAQNLFPNGIKIDGDQDVATAETKFHIDSHKPETVLFQAAIKNEPYYIRTDILKWNAKEKGFELYEVKATTKVKKEKFNNHIYDLAFQYNVCISAGLNIIKMGVIHMNREYKKDGDINYSQLFVNEDVTSDVKEVSDIVADEMKAMIEYLNGPEEKFCQCRYRTRSPLNNCATFDYSNPDIPEYSVHDVSRISAKKLSLLVDDEILDIHDIPENFEFSDNQILQIQSARINKPIINHEEIEEFLGSFQYPLFFFDYESYLPAIPWFNRYGPYQNIVFQYSLHILEKEPPKDADKKWFNENLKHTEFLATEARDPSKDMVEALKKDIGEGKGSIIVWHKPFEQGRNKELAELQPADSDFMYRLNDRIIDLKEIFSKSMYVDPRSKGSASIKKILPIMAPELSYKDLPINNGADANKKWGRMIKGEMTPEDIEKTQRDLLKYCKQDTFAMVRIWEELQKIID
jgi:hypothetical protein